MTVTGGSGRNAAFCLSINGKIYVGGGYVATGTDAYDFYEYDPATDKWTKKADLPGATNRSAGISFSANGKGYIGLGTENYLSTSPENLLKDLWMYDPATDTWTQKASLPDSGRNNSACFVVNNKAYVIGGEVTSSGLVTTDVWEYDVTNDTWASKSPYPNGPVEMPFAFSIGNKGYISCGLINKAASIDKTFEYDPAADTWTPKKDFPGANTEGGVAFTINNLGYCGTGTPDYSSYSNSFYSYDPATDNWTNVTNAFPGSTRAFGVAATVGNIAYVGAGWAVNTTTGSETFYSDWYSFGSGTKVITIHKENYLVYFPNPASQNITVQSNNITIPPDCPYTIYNSVGQVALQGRLEKTHIIDVSCLSTGVYILELQSDEARYRTNVTIRK
jgi:N-acetylneuraminic acid mutarotase